MAPETLVSEYERQRQEQDLLRQYKRLQTQLDLAKSELRRRTTLRDTYIAAALSGAACSQEDPEAVAKRAGAGCSQG